ncbi:MAG: hypothetical protein LBB74_09645 [Chitinispirillales bacterium]|nr:hypothetical protein [Chitinispirillales bacterium]
MTCKLESNNTFEMKLDENLFSKGTYTANQPNFTLTVTHAHGATFNAKIEEMFGEMLEEWSISIPPGTFAIESKWYTKNELKTAISDKFAGIAGIGLDGFGFSDEDFEEGFGYMFEPHNGTYHFDSDNKLAVTYRDETNREITNIFTRQ